MGEDFSPLIEDLNAQKEPILLLVYSASAFSIPKMGEQYTHTCISCYANVKQNKNSSIHSSIFCSLVPAQGCGGCWRLS